jgi:hypothetical protein
MQEYRLHALLQAESSHIQAMAEKAWRFEQTPLNRPLHEAQVLDLPTTKDRPYDRLTPRYADLVFAQTLKAKLHTGPRYGPGQ